MNVAESLLLQQMQQMAAAMTALPQTNSSNKDQSGSFQDMMTQVGKDSGTTDAGKDSDAAEQPVQDKTADDSTVQENPAAQTSEKDAAKNQELNGDPNAMQAVMDMFRPEIIDVSQAETVVETAPVEVLAVETVVEAPVEAVAEIPVEEAEAQIPTEETQVPIQEGAEPAEQTEEPFPEVVQETAETVQRPEAAKEQPVQSQETVPEQNTEIVETVVKDTPETANEKPENGAADTQGEAAELSQEPVFHDVESAPVKVAENYKTLDTQAPDMDEKLAATIRQGMEDGTERIELRLNPANLGQVTIEMTRDSSGTLQVALHVTSGRAESLLNQHLDSLHAALQSYGQGQEVKVEVQRNQEAPQQQNQHQANPDGHNQNHQQHRQREQRQEEHSEDFLQKLRLGLFSGEE